MAYKQNAGRGPMMKTGNAIPSALLQTPTSVKPTNDKNKKQEQDPGFFETVANAFNDAYKNGKGVTYGGGSSGPIFGQGNPGSGSRKGNKDITLGPVAAVKAGYNYLFGDKKPKNEKPKIKK
jgi:hypothetical protein